MADSVIMERVADAAAECFYAEPVKTEDLGAFEALVAADMRSIAAGVLRRCIERFDAELVGNMPRGWSVHERAARTLVTLVIQRAGSRLGLPNSRRRSRTFREHRPCSRAKYARIRQSTRLAPPNRTYPSNAFLR